MHETGAVNSIISAVNAKLKEFKKPSKVKKINIVIGELEHIEPSHFEFHFRELTKNTPLEKVKLHFKRPRTQLKCKDCGCEFMVKKDATNCPQCKSAFTKIIAGDEVFVESIEI